MDVVILAGGFGTRMRPLTYTRPKPLLPLLNGTLLANILSRLPSGVRRVVLPVNYLREQIEDHFQRHPDPRVVLVEESQPLGTGGAIKNCQDHLSEEAFLVYNGDIVSNLDLDELWKFHHSQKAEATISLWPVDEPWHFGVADLESNGRIRSFIEKPPKGKESGNLINAGHYVLNRDVLDHIPAGTFFSLERELYAPWARSGRRLFGYPFKGYWIDCGRPESLLEAHKRVLEERGKDFIVDPTVALEANAQVRGYAVAEGCHMGQGSIVERSVLLPRVQLGAGAQVRDSILGEGVEVEEGARLEHAVVGDWAVIERGREIRNQKIGLRAVDAEA